MADSSVSPEELQEPHRLAVRELPATPKAGAVKALGEKLEARGFTKSAAASIARAAVDPSDLRRRLDRPTPVRVPGAILWTVETDVWTPMVVPYVVNYREADARVFPADETVDEAPRFPPIRRPKGDSNGRPTLDIDVRSHDHLTFSVETSIRYLVEHNPLTESIAERGVMFPVTVVSTVVSVEEGEPVAIPATADGSSRTANALEVLGLSAGDVLGKFRTDPRVLSGLVGHYRTVLQRPLGEIAEDDIGKANALMLPARIVIGFEPDRAGNADFAKAVHNYVQLIHGDLPPKAWPETARIDAKAESVVGELEYAQLITPNKARYFEGMFSASEAAKRKFPRTADERGLCIVSALSSRKPAVHAAIRRAVVQPTERKNVTKLVKAELCAELALRGTRGLLSPKELVGARDVLADLYLHSAIWEQEIKPSGMSPDDLLKEALQERKTGKGGPATAELAALGGFWLTVRRTLREARFFASQDFRDSRTSRSVLSALMDSEWGLQILARAVMDGREGDVVQHVDVNGKRVKSATGKFMELDNDLLRGEVVPPGGKEKDDDDPGFDGPPLPERMLLDRRNRLEEAVNLLEQRDEELREVRGSGGKPLVESHGISESVTNDLRERIEAIRTRLAFYGAAWSSNSASADTEQMPEQAEAEE